MIEQCEWFLSDNFKLAVSLVVFVGKNRNIFGEKKIIYILLLSNFKIYKEKIKHKHFPK
jgi:hypothetical protein